MATRNRAARKAKARPCELGAHGDATPRMIGDIVRAPELAAAAQAALASAEEELAESARYTAWLSELLVQTVAAAGGTVYIPDPEREEPYQIYDLVECHSNPDGSFTLRVAPAEEGK